MTHKIDATNRILGRLATEIAIILRGKNSVNFSANNYAKLTVEVINAGKIKVSGNKANQKIYWRYSGYPGGIKQATFEKVFTATPDKVLRNAVYGMLPKNRLRNKMLKNLKISA